MRNELSKQERLIVEQADDEQRWQRYLSDGCAIPFETVRDKLHSLAAKARVL